MAIMIINFFRRLFASKLLFDSYPDCIFYLTNIFTKYLLILKCALMTTPEINVLMLQPQRHIS